MNVWTNLCILSHVALKLLVYSCVSSIRLSWVWINKARLLCYAAINVGMQDARDCAVLHVRTVCKFIGYWFILVLDLIMFFFLKH